MCQICINLRNELPATIGSLIWFMICLIDWLADRLIDCLIDWLIDWLIVWLFYWLADWLVKRLWPVNHRKSNLVILTTVRITVLFYLPIINLNFLHHKELFSIHQMFSFLSESVLLIKWPLSRRTHHLANGSFDWLIDWLIDYLLTGHNIQLHGSAPLDPEAPPNYDDIFGPGHRAGSASQSPHTSSSSSAATSPRSAPPIPSPSSSFAIPPPSQAAWGTAVPGAPSQHPQYTNPAPNWRQQEEEAELRMWFSAVDENK